MQRYLALVLALSIAVVGCTAESGDTGEVNAPAVDQEQVRSAIESQNERFERYVTSQQYDSLALLYTIDGRLMPPNSPSASGPDLISAFEGMASLGVTGLELETEEVEAADEFAYEVGSYTLFGPDDAEIDNGKYIVIWKMGDGEWKLHRDIFNSNVAPPDTTQS